VNLKKALLPWVMAFSLLASPASAAITVAKPGDITIQLNGSKLSLSQAPLVSNGTVFVPLRSIADAIGTKVSWNAQTRMITITNGETTTLLAVQQKTIKKNGQTIVLEKAPLNVNGHVFVPLSGVDELFGVTAEWNAQTRAISITHKQGQLPVVGSYENLKALLRTSQEIPMYRTAMAETAIEKSASSSAKSDLAANYDYSATNVQVQGVDEADVVKTDGAYLYQVNGQKVVIAKLYPATEMKVVNTLSFSNPHFNPLELYVDDKHLVVIGSAYYEEPVYRAEETAKARIYPPTFRNNTVKALVYDVQDKTQLKLVRELELEGQYVSSRKVDSSLYIITNKYVSYYHIMNDNAKDGEQPAIPAPLYTDSATSEKRHTIPYDKIHYFPGIVTPNYLFIAGVDLDKPKQKAEVSSYLGAGENIYATEDNLYVAVTKRSFTAAENVKPANRALIAPDYIPGKTDTTVYKFALHQGKTTYKTSGTVPGTVLNQFSMDEHKGYFRIATTSGDQWRSDQHTSKNNLYILDEQLKMTGQLEDIAPGERIYSVRFMADRAYMVTFKKVDPLFVIDVKNPKAPKILGALKIPGYSDYLHPYDENHIIGFGKDTVELPIKNEQGKTVDTTAYYQGMKVALFDVSDVKHPKEKFKEIIGDRGTESELLHNHKALLFSKEKNLLAFPVTLREITQTEQSQFDFPAYGKFTFQGAMIYQLDLQNGFTLRKKITHISEEDLAKAGDGWYNSEKNVERIIYIGDVLYTLSKGMVKAHDISTLREQNSLIIK